MQRSVVPNPGAVNNPGSHHSLLNEEHLLQLRRSGLGDEIIAERGYRSVTGAEVKKIKTPVGTQMFSDSQCRSGILLPLHTTDGSDGFCVLRPDKPRINADGKPLKYEIPKGQRMRLDCPPRCKAMLSNPVIPLDLTEGQKKADALAMNGRCAIALLGVWNFRGKNDLGGETFLADWEYIALNGRAINIIFDSDVMVKTSVRAALDSLTEFLQRKGAHVSAVYLPMDNGGKVGVDDYLLDHSVADLQGLVEAPRPMPSAAAPMIEILDDSPAILSKPLQLIDGVSYAATWLWTQRTVTESLAKDGSIIVHDPPMVDRHRELFIVKGDGTIYGIGGEPISNLGVDVILNDPPLDSKLWSAAAVKRYRAGKRPNAIDVLNHMASVYNHYLDFARSLGTQQQMCRFSACLTIATYFADAFTVMGYPWPNGEKGCGKTKWANIWAMASYLGMLITAGGSFAALRDLAEYGAALALDDAENLNDPKRIDPDKRALFLAGNRKGVQIPLKEQVGDKWQTRWVNAYAPRAFTAINVPDEVLYSRSTVIPLVRTGDSARANRDPAKANRWPVDLRQLIDDLWALAVWLLPDAEQVWNELDDETETVGRDLEPWRAALATARLLERQGVPGLEADIRSIMQTYFDERGNTIEGDRQGAVALAIVRHVESLVLKAACAEKISDVSDVSDVRTFCTEGWTFSASDIVSKLKALATDESEDDAVGEPGTESASWLNSKAVGWQLKRLRLQRDRTPDRKRTKLRRVTLDQLLGIAAAFHVQTFLYDVFNPPHKNVRTSETSETSDSEVREMIEI